MATCGVGQYPFEAYYAGGGNAFGNTRGEACEALSLVMEELYSDGRYISWTGSQCIGFEAGGVPMDEWMFGINENCQLPGSGGGTTVNCEGTCTVTLKHEFEHPNVAAPLTGAMAGDYMALWAAFIGVAVVVLCAKAIYSYFRIDYDH